MSKTKTSTNMVTCLPCPDGCLYRLYFVPPGDELHAGDDELLQVHGGKFLEWIESQRRHRPGPGNRAARPAIPSRASGPRLTRYHPARLRPRNSNAS